MLRRCFAAMDMLLIVVQGVSFRPPQYDSAGALGSMVAASGPLRATAFVVQADVAGRCMRERVCRRVTGRFVRVCKRLEKLLSGMPERAGARLCFNACPSLLCLYIDSP